MPQPSPSVASPSRSAFMDRVPRPPAFATPAEERRHRKERLAAAFRLFSRFGFDEGVAGHITARDPERLDHFWVNPFGMHFGQIRVSDLILVDHSGNVVEGRAEVNLAAFAIHSRIHAARPDVVAAAHAHSLYGKSWSTLGRLLDALTQDACAFYEDHVVFEDYSGIVEETSEGDRIARALGAKKAAILRNHGLLTVGHSVDEATWWFITMDRSCQAQLLAEAAGEPRKIPHETAKHTYALVGSSLAGWFQFQPLYQRISREHPDLFEQLAFASMPPNGVACILVPSKPVQFFPPRLRISMGTRMAHHAILLSRPALGSAMQNAAKTPRILWSAVIFLAFIGVTAVSHRALALLYPATFTGKFPPARALDDLFAAHRSLTLVHIIPGFLFMVLALLQFAKNIRSRYPRFHRWSGRLLVVSGLIIGFTAIWMSLTMSFGGVNQAAATLLFGILFLFSLGKAFLHIRRREIAQHREWMLRAFAIGLAVATIRPIIGIFFATSRFTHLTPQEFFGTAFWIGFTLQLIAAESWIYYTRNKLAPQSAANSTLRMDRAPASSTTPQACQTSSHRLSAG